MRPIVLTALLASVLSACGGPPASDPANVRTGAALVVKEGSAVDFGHGVWYFHAVRADFGNLLAAFLVVHPDLEVASLTGDGTGTYGTDLGYFVIFREKSKCPIAEAPAK